MKLNLAAGAHPLEGFTNLDKGDGWTFESGIPFADESVEGITESHGLMYLPFVDWPRLFDEMYRVLVRGGVVRITEDATDDLNSERYGGFHDAVTLTSFALVDAALRRSGFQAAWMPPDGTMFNDSSLIQTWHGMPPKVFFIEGLKA